METGNSLAGTATEPGSTYTKDIRLDLLFEYASGGLMLRINEEPQTTQRSYSESPVPEMDEPVVRYSLRLDEAYAYRDGVPLADCKRKFDSGDLMGIVLVSVPDVERIYRDSALLDSGKYDADVITV